MGRAHTIAVSDSGEALYVNTEESGERGSFHLADLGKALGNVCHRAMMLAELFAGR